MKKIKVFFKIAMLIGIVWMLFPNQTKENAFAGARDPHVDFDNGATTCFNEMTRVCGEDCIEDNQNGETPPN